ncbi:hypothetical protein EDM55_11525 [Brevibacillus centrosporus]|nr:hypothetical protein EDM55_11525 [Brevibacillus centrosporus]
MGTRHHVETTFFAGCGAAALHGWLTGIDKMKAQWQSRTLFIRSTSDFWLALLLGRYKIAVAGRTWTLLGINPDAKTVFPLPTMTMFKLVETGILHLKRSYGFGTIEGWSPILPWGVPLTLLFQPKEIMFPENKEIMPEIPVYLCAKLSTFFNYHCL